MATKKPAATSAAAPASKANVSDKELLGHYREMLLIRRFEEKAGQLYGMGLIGGFCHLYIGQEAVVVGLEAVAEEGDKRVTSYRDHGHMLACGMDPNGIMAELTGREGGFSKGKGGSMHMFSKRSISMVATASLRHRCPSERPGLCGQIPWQRPRDLCLFRRWRGQSGSGLRDLQHGRAMGSAGRVRDREQPVCHGHLGPAVDQVSLAVATGRGLRYSRRGSRRDERSGREGGRRAGP
jgi:hypothetical protein